MGGSINAAMGSCGFCPERGPDAEWNIVNDIDSAKKLFQSGGAAVRDAAGFHAIEIGRNEAGGTCSGRARG